MAFNGTRLFRYALLGEAAINIAGAIPIILNPDSMLKLLVRGPTMINPATRTLTQWFGGLTLALTVPIVLSYPNPHPSRGSSSEVMARRRTTYLTLGAGELALGTIMAAQYLLGGSGLTDSALLAGMGMMGGIAAMRGFFLYVRPSWMAAQGNAEKAL
ncbi:hypothetical protein KC332_g10769 [Hortaea werneckii]|uniref:Uncharacterized protein n=2 Tax=Hortaea werneckii TaxID=91943 RepID=A0A3M7HRR2_HORWE|nr:hypothetical protein KC358_g11003 [Hortaea werneckii]OTA29649.1 hypothetical protein BTJ68_09503 [Hortaea werneckii EXF-2000]KAI6818834.1 hypothetical protein KC350_g10194 [Hortaea werneckii]KAI6930195.1 hypothetical protein KC341_g10378 [Hortaea werneckii]KAI6941006.1 hypothetical protein KC348_g4826 [Hortaea werneckii]